MSSDSFFSCTGSMWKDLLVRHRSHDYLWISTRSRQRTWQAGQPNQHLFDKLVCCCSELIAKVRYECMHVVRSKTWCKAQDHVVSSILSSTVFRQWETSRVFSVMQWRKHPSKWQPNMQGKLLSHGCLVYMSLYWCCTGAQTAAATTCNSTALFIAVVSCHPRDVIITIISSRDLDVVASLGVKGHIMPSPGFRGICMAAMLAWWLCRWWCWLGSRFMPILPWP